MLVKNVHYDKPNELYDLLLIIILSFTDENIVQYYTQNNKHIRYTNVYNYCVDQTENLNNYIWFITIGDRTTGYFHRLTKHVVYLQASFLTKTKQFITDENIMLISL